jgi:hypothetical protein
MGIIGTLRYSDLSFVRFAYEDGNVQAVYQNISGHVSGEIEVLTKVRNFDEACRFVATQYSPYGKNPNFSFEMDGRYWAVQQGWAHSR